MQYYYRVFEFKNGAKSNELTQYVQMPIFIEDRLDETLDSGEISLLLPIEMKNIIPQKTKIRIERYIDKESFDNMMSPNKTWDMLASINNVEIFEGCANICIMRVDLIEASAWAQNVHIDNMALTYDLQDVSLKYKTYREDTENHASIEILPAGHANPIKSPTNPNSNFDYGNTPAFGNSYTSVENFFINTYLYSWREESLTNIKALFKNLELNSSHIIDVEIPKLICKGCPNGDYFEDLFEMPTLTRVWKTKMFNGVQVGEKELVLITDSLNNTATEVHYNPTSALNSSSNNSAYFISNNKIFLRTLDEWATTSKGDGWFTAGDPDKFSAHYAKNPVNIATISTASADRISFSTQALSSAEIEEGYSLKYDIECVANPDNSNTMIGYYELKALAEKDVPNLGRYWSTGTLQSIDIINPNNVSVVSSFQCVDLSVEAATNTHYLLKGVKYSCYDFLRKAIMSVDTHIFDNNEVCLDEGRTKIESSTNIEVQLQTPQLPVIISPRWETRLKSAKVYETILEQKNLWEVFLQAGYYLHAIPFLEFEVNNEGMDRFILNFRQLGDYNRTKEDNSQKITIFNSRNIEEYFTEYDSYVTNMFSPQNIIEEWFVPKTNDSSNLIYNDVAIGKVAKGISEIVYFGIKLGNREEKDATSYIYEKSIYDILTSDANVIPSKGYALFYKLGGNEIDGMTYVPPSINTGDYPMALKRILNRLYACGFNVRFNEVVFHIKYRTQDDMRFSQVRPDLENFMKVTSYEKYPHNEQFYGQQDKIVDSERFSANLYGQLVRKGNDIYQRQECPHKFYEKESGDLVEIDSEVYFVTQVENEMYNDAIFQKVSYSKNFNQLSQICAIPSEPRFYQVSEQTKVRREKRLKDFFAISTTCPTIVSPPVYLNSVDNIWQTFLSNIIFDYHEVLIPNFAWTRFKADKHRLHKNNMSVPISANEMFPSSETERLTDGTIQPKESSANADVIVPLLHFPMHDGIMFEWDMQDNFKAGEYVDVSINGENDSVDKAYYAQQSVRYCDVMGRADLFNFQLFTANAWDISKIQRLPMSYWSEEDIVQNQETSLSLVPINLSASLDKDCREEISFNYYISLLYRNDDGQGDFVTFPNLFGEKGSRLNCCLINKAVSAFDENIQALQDGKTIIVDNVQYSICIEGQMIYIRFSGTYLQNNEECVIDSAMLSRTKAIIFYETNSYNDKVSYLAKNFKNGIQGGGLPSFYIYPVFNN